MSLDPDRWTRLCIALGLPDADRRFDELCAAYGERPRHYHTAQHINECLTVFDESGRVAEHPLEVEFAIYLHDVVYRPRRGDNETASAELAKLWLEDAGASDTIVERVVHLIEMTRHDAIPENDDAALLIDVDLNVLGAPRDRYDEYEAQVRREYRWAPGPIFRRRRAELLERFLERTSLYYTPYFQTRFEQPARRNLKRAIANLRGPAG